MTGLRGDFACLQSQEIKSCFFKYRFPLLFAGHTFLTKSQTANTKTGTLGLNEAKNSSFPSLFAFFSPQIARAACI